MNAWAGPTLAATRIGAILQEVWWSDSFHPSPRTGAPTAIRHRAIPSAGACYPVQTHVLCGQDGEAGGTRAVYDHETNRLVRLGRCTLGSGTLVILTVLPQRAAGKYHHRAWPGLIADAAYALTAIAAVAARHGLAATRLDDLTPHGLADMAGLPRHGTRHGAWPTGWRGRAPELAITALHLGNGAVPALEGLTSTAAAPAELRSHGSSPDVSSLAEALGEAAGLGGTAAAALSVPAISTSALAARRSMPFADMHSSARRPPTPAWSAGLMKVALEIAEGARPTGCSLHLVTPHDHAALAEAVERSSAQEWLRMSDLLVLFTAREGSTPAHLVSCLWWATLAAANLVFQATDERMRTRSRPVAGWTDAHGGAARETTLSGQRILHAVALFHEGGAAS
ncbi:hypothetical protein GY21_17460 [Cryobacterium roopkundense]|nr:hypothetical protein [Cryobacterium roopkundense]KGJ72119.1 hypothetical protein GY21_17460 [Cryobacterium roopkundense]